MTAIKWEVGVAVIYCDVTPLAYIRHVTKKFDEEYVEVRNAYIASRAKYVRHYVEGKKG